MNKAEQQNEINVINFFQCNPTKKLEDVNFQGKDVDS